MSTAAQGVGVREEFVVGLSSLGELEPAASILMRPPGAEIVYLDDEPPQEPAPETAAAPRLRRRWVAGAAAGLLLAAAVAGLPGQIRRERSQRCRGNIERIGQALLEYQREHGALPPAVLTGKNGQPLLSWRVAILPYLGRRDLYDRFRFDEPWDGPHNAALLDKMPDVFACPSDGRCRKLCATPYLVVVGPEENLQTGKPLFERTRGVDEREILDGASFTLMVAEARSLVPWTKPDDLSYAPDAPLPQFGVGHGGSFNMVYASGRASEWPSRRDESLLRAAITRDGLEANEFA